MTYHIAKIFGLILFLSGLALMMICSFYIYLCIGNKLFLADGAVLKNDFGSFSLAGIFLFSLIGEIIGAIWIGAGAIVLSISGR